MVLVFFLYLASSFPLLSSSRNLVVSTSVPSRKIVLIKF